MTEVPLSVADLDLRPGDHVCAFYNRSDTTRDDIIAAYVAEGLRAGDKCVCYIDDLTAVQERLPAELRVHPGMTVFREADEVYMPEGDFSREAHFRRLDDLASSTLKEGYSFLRLLGDARFAIRRALDTKEWFTYEAEVYKFAPRYPQFLLCLYDLDYFDGSLVVNVLKTHPRILLNGMVIKNPYYRPPGEFLAAL